MVVNNSRKHMKQDNSSRIATEASKLHVTGFVLDLQLNLPDH